jgi:hypothetical protein
MQESAQIWCPWCGETFELVLDMSPGEQRMVTDCEVCCRPIDLLVRIEGGEWLVEVAS